MPKLIKNGLTVRQVETITKPGFYTDGGGLYLQVGASSKSWVFRYQILGRRRDMGLGSTRSVTLCQARAMAFQAHQVIAVEGKDPLDKRQTENAKRQAENATLRQARAMAYQARQVIAVERKDREREQSRLEEKQQLELRQQFRNFHWLVLRLARGPWPGPEELARLKSEYAAPTRQVFANHLKPAIARLSAFLVAIDASGDQEIERLKAGKLPTSINGGEVRK